VIVSFILAKLTSKQESRTWRVPNRSGRTLANSKFRFGKPDASIYPFRLFLAILSDFISISGKAVCGCWKFFFFFFLSLIPSISFVFSFSFFPSLVSFSLFFSFSFFYLRRSSRASWKGISTGVDSRISIQMRVFAMLSGHCGRESLSAIAIAEFDTRYACAVAITSTIKAFYSYGFLDAIRRSFKLPVYICKYSTSGTVDSIS